MIIERDLEPLSIYEDSSLEHAISKLNGLEERALVCVDRRGLLKGVLSLGDINRYILQNGGCSTEDVVSHIVNKHCFFIDDNIVNLEEQAAGFHFVPVVRNGQVTGVAVKKSVTQLQIDGKNLARGNPFIIAEIGNNHNGSKAKAKELVRLAHDSGADCVKFQLRDMHSLYGEQINEASQNLGAQYTLDLLSRFQLPTAELLEVMRYARELGLVALCTPWDAESVDVLERFGVSAYKVASADLTNHGLLRYIATKGKPLICSTGMSSEEEILEAVQVLGSCGAKFVLLHCNSTYPTPFKDVQLSYINRLQKLTNNLVGYSGHERDINVAIAAVALGASVIEKHFTTDRGQEGSDHKVSLLPEEFSAMVKGVRQVASSLGDEKPRSLSQGELMNRVTLAKSVFASRNIEVGAIITREDIVVKSPGHGLQPNRIDELVGRRIERPISKGDVFFPADIESNVVLPRSYNFWSKWGLPVRHHDYKKIYELGKPPLLEFHFSYKDLILNNEDYFSEKLDVELIVHAPELFENDHTLDLSSPDDGYRRLSIRNMEKTIDAVKRLKPYFSNSERPIGLITNVGGFSSAGPLSHKEIQERTDILRESLLELRCREIEIWPQTMPPYPWHFGGQQYHNLFLSADWIVDFCKAADVNVCLDISHSILHCHSSHESPAEFLDKVLPYTAHLHLADARGIDGEGLQIGEGDVDFYLVAEKLKEIKPSATWIPEIWQGHEENGKGFWIACERLEKAGF